MKTSKSKLYLPWIRFATVLAMIAICIIFYILITRYLQWKDNELTQESFLDISNKTNVGIVSMIKKPKNIDTWLNKHRDLGVCHFYIRLEETPELEEYLEQQPDVTVQKGKSTGVNEYLEKQTRQDVWVNEAFKLAKSDKSPTKWLVHIDGDEILQGNLKKVQELPDNIHTFWMQNKEAKFDKIPGESDNCFSAKKFVDCGKSGAGCVSYVNGKSGGRVDSDVTPIGPHRMKSTKEKGSLKLDDLEVEHYESCDFNIYKEKFKGLSVQDKSNDIPFSYYKESIDAAKEDNDDKLKSVFKKYRIDT